jgi:N-acetylmuramoyl-L-alanine amidase
MSSFRFALFSLLFLFGSAIISPQVNAQRPAVWNDKVARLGKHQNVVESNVTTRTLDQASIPTAEDLPVRQQPPGVLHKKIIYIGAGHGWTYDSHDQKGSRVWFTQRGNADGVVEDYGNQDQMTLFADQLWLAGATVVPTRPIGNQLKEVVLDQDSPGVTYRGDWWNCTSSKYYGKQGDAVSYVITQPSKGEETAAARYTPTLPESGYYPVYTWVANSDNRVEQLYRIRTPECMTEVTVNHRRVGKGWVWLGTYYFDATQPGYVEVSNRVAENEPGLVVVADAIRFGNGMGDVDRGEGVSGFGREEEGSRYWAEVSTGIPPRPDIWEMTVSDQADNVGAPPRWVIYMNNELDGTPNDRVYISFHSNAAGRRGAVGLYNKEEQYQTANQELLATLLGQEVNEDMQQLDTMLLSGEGKPQWSDRTRHTYRGHINYGEINRKYITDEMDATINEVAFHDKADDRVFLKDLASRRVMAASTLQGTVRFFNQLGHGTLAMPPEPPQHPSTWNDPEDPDSVIVAWFHHVDRASTKPGTPGNIGGDPATHYIIYGSVGGRDFTPIKTIPRNNSPFQQTRVSGIKSGSLIFFRVTAANAAGESLPSYTVGLGRTELGSPKLLVVDAFDREGPAFYQKIDRNNLGRVARIIPQRINDHSGIVPVGKALMTERHPHVFDTVSNEAVVANLVQLDKYEQVIWLCGQESTQHETVSSLEQQLLARFLKQSGDLVISGSELGWDLKEKGSPEDQGFLYYALRTDFIADSADTFKLRGRHQITSDFPVFKINSGEMLGHVAEYCDVLAPVEGSEPLLEYANGKGAAALGHRGTEDVPGGTAVFGFPLECITDPMVLEELLHRSLVYLGDAE